MYFDWMISLEIIPYPVWILPFPCLFCFSLELENSCGGLLLESFKADIYYSSISDLTLKMPPFVKQKAARTHTESLKTVCAACWRKPKNVRNVSDRVEELIRQFVFKDYSKSNGYHPSVVCTGCQQTLSDLAKVKLLNIYQTCCKTESSAESVLAVGSSLFLRFLLKLPIFGVQKAATPKNGVEFRQKSIGAIRCSLATLYDHVRCHVTFLIHLLTDRRNVMYKDTWLRTEFIVKCHKPNSTQAESK